MKTDYTNGIVHCLLTDPGGANVFHVSFDGSNFGEPYNLMYFDYIYDGGCDVDLRLRRNGTRGTDLAISPDGSEVAVATLHPAQNVYIFKGSARGDVWPDSFETGMASGSIIALFDTTGGAMGMNIPDDQAKPFTEVQIDYDADSHLHVTFEATYISTYLDTVQSGYWFDHGIKWSRQLIFGGAGDTSAVFYDGIVHPRPQICYWSDITRTVSTLAKCRYPLPGQQYRWYNFGIPDSGIASWGKHTNDSPIANLRFFVNRNHGDDEPHMVCVWEEMQEEVTPLSDADGSLGKTYYAYKKDIMISVSDDGVWWTAPYNITTTEELDESDVSVYEDVIDSRIHMVYYEDDLPGSDRNLNYVDAYEDRYIHGWPGVPFQLPVEIRKETTKQVNIVYRSFDLENIPSRIEPGQMVVSDFRLGQNYPNPFNPVTTIRFTIPGGDTRVDIIDVSGRHVNTLVNDLLPAGSYEESWDGTNGNNIPVASGIYLCRLKTEMGTRTVKMLLRR